MAERRMFAKTIIDSDAFLEMPLSTQALYFHLSMRADDEGFINNPKKIARMLGASDDDMRVLMAKNFLIAFDSGVIVIKHWKIHNYIRGDRIKETVYKEEASMLVEKDNGAYTLTDGAKPMSVKCQSNVSQVTDKCQSIVSQMSVNCQSSDGQVTDKCQHRLGKYSIGKDSIEIGKESKIKISGTYNNVKLTEEQAEALRKDYPNRWQAMIENLSKYMHDKNKEYADHYATIIRWAKQDNKGTTKHFENEREYSDKYLEDLLTRDKEAK